MEYLTEEASEVIAHEPGCRDFLVSRSRENPNVFTLAEFYDDGATLEAHRQTSHFILFQERVREFGLIADRTAVLGDVVFPM